jgi:hypothetical protein
VVFHNGEPFNAEAVRATVERVSRSQPEVPEPRQYRGDRRAWRWLDEATVNIVTQKPYAPLPQPAPRLRDACRREYTAEKGNQGAALRPSDRARIRFVGWSRTIT